MAKPQSVALATATTQNQALSVGHGDVTSNRGKEGIEIKAANFPRVALAQKTSPQIDSGKDECIDGLKLYQMFNTLTGEVYGNGPIAFSVIKYSRRALQFDATMQIVDFNVPWTDPRCEFTTGSDGSRQKPIATRFHEFLIALLPTPGSVIQERQLAVLSLKSTQNKVADKLQMLMGYRPGDAWLGRYTLTSGPKTAGSYTYANFNVVPAGPASTEDIDFAAGVYERYSGATIETDRDVDAKTDDDTIPF